MRIFNTLITSVLQIVKIRMEYPVTLLIFGLGWVYSSFCTNRSVDFSKGNVCEIANMMGLPIPSRGDPHSKAMMLLCLAQLGSCSKLYVLANNMRSLNVVPCHHTAYIHHTETLLLQLAFLPMCT